MASWQRTVIAIVLVIVGAGQYVPAADGPVLGSEPAFELTFNLDAIQKSPIGSQLVEAGKKFARQELGDEFSWDRVIKTLGFDPLTEVRSISISASDFESPEKSLVSTIQMRKTTGNLEGLLLALPNYESIDYGSTQIHSIKLNDKAKLFATVLTNANNDKSIVITSSNDDVTRILDRRALEKDVSPRLAGQPEEPNALFNLTVLRLPKEFRDKGPQANISAILKSLALNLVDRGDDLVIQLRLAAANDKKADQIKQMAQGAAALMELATSLDDDKDEDVEMICNILREIKTERDGATVKLTLGVTRSSLKSLLQYLDVGIELD